MNKTCKNHLWLLASIKALLIPAVVLCLFMPGMNAYAQSSEAIVPTPTPAKVLKIDPNAGAQITPTPIPVEPGVVIPGWGGIKLPAGVTEAAASLYNPEANADLYYLTFELRIKETDEVIFSTGLIPPGLYCNKVELTRPLEVGTYEAILHVQPYRMNESLSHTNNADLDVHLIVY